MDNLSCNDNFPEQVKTCLTKMELTQKELAEIIGITPEYLYGILQGRRKGLKHREKIRAVLGIPSVKESITKYLEMSDRY